MKQKLVAGMKGFFKFSKDKEEEEAGAQHRKPSHGEAGSKANKLDKFFKKMDSKTHSRPFGAGSSSKSKK